MFARLRQRRATRRVLETLPEPVVVGIQPDDLEAACGIAGLMRWRANCHKGLEQLAQAQDCAICLDPLDVFGSR